MAAEVQVKQNRAVLSKSTFIRGLQCPKSLYLHKKRPFLRDRLSEQKKAVFSRGTTVGVLARDLFPGGINAAPKTHFQMAAAAIKTTEYIKSGHNIIYEAVFQYDDVIIALDILVKEEGRWKAIEVKSSRDISDTYLWDAALQYYVISGNGIEPDDFEIALINKEYVRQGEIDPSSLFCRKSILDQVKERQLEVAGKIKELKSVAGLSASPEQSIGLQCFDPYDCDFLGHCWKKMPADSVFKLRGISQDMKFELYNKGIVKVEDIPSGLLEGKEDLKQQVESVRYNKVIADKSRLSDLMEKACISVPCMSLLYGRPAVPLFDGYKPYDFMLFSFSIGIMEAGNIKLETYNVPPQAPVQESFITGLLNYALHHNALLVFDARPIKQMFEVFEIQFPHLKEDIRKFCSLLIDMKAVFNDNSVILPDILKDETPASILKSLNRKTAAATFYKTSSLYQELISNGSNVVSPDYEKEFQLFHKAELQNLFALRKFLSEIFEMAD